MVLIGALFVLSKSPFEVLSEGRGKKRFSSATREMAPVYKRELLQDYFLPPLQMFLTWLALCPS